MRIGRVEGGAKEREAAIGKDLSFAAAEAYRLMRTNLQFCLPQEYRSRVIGITSSRPGEGKSTTAMNLSYMLAEANKKVVLVEADLRLPSVSRRLGLQPKPGLSNLLVGLKDGERILQDSGIEKNLRVISAGEIPPNPSELLGSDGMKNAMEALTSQAEYVILDLPPVNEVSDVLVVAPLVDGMIMVVRQNYASRRDVTEAMQQLKNANVKVLGFVMTHADTLEKGKYGKGKYGGKYGKYYSRGYRGYARGET